MKTAPRLLVAALTALAALAAAGTATAAYESLSMAVVGPNALNRQAPLTIAIAQRREDDATFRLVIYVPRGYGATFNQSAGTQVGTVEAQVNARAIDPNALVRLQGSIRAADPAPYRANAQSLACVGAGNAIDAVYLLVLNSPVPPPFEIPLYVTSVTAGAEAAFAQAKLTACLPSPNVPEAQGGARLGAKLVSAVLNFTASFRSPARSNAYRWRALATPYSAGTAAPNPAGTIETQSVDLPGARVTIRAAQSRRTGRVTVTGTFGNATRVAIGARVQIFSGRRVVARVRTNNRGAYRATLRLRRGRYTLRARAGVGAVASRCTAPISPSIRCLRSTVAGFSLDSRSVRIRVR